MPNTIVPTHVRLANELRTRMPQLSADQAEFMAFALTNAADGSAAEVFEKRFGSFGHEQLVQGVMALLGY